MEVPISVEAAECFRAQTRRARDANHSTGKQPILATLMEDQTSLPFTNAEAQQGYAPTPTVAIEIKPKCGFLPKADCVGLQHSLKTQVSKFQMQQRMKLAQVC